MSLIIDEIEKDDFAQWLPLWDGNNQGQKDENVTAETWARLTDPASMVCGLVARLEGQIVGLTHYILHPTTGHIRPVCYMQDVYVALDHRKKGIARKLVNSLAIKGKKEEWARMYWLAESNNEAAQNLYKNLGIKLDFTFHIMPL